MGPLFSAAPLKAGTRVDSIIYIHRIETARPLFRYPSLCPLSLEWVAISAQNPARTRGRGLNRCGPRSVMDTHQQHAGAGALYNVMHCAKLVYYAAYACISA